MRALVFSATLVFVATLEFLSSSAGADHQVKQQEIDSRPSWVEAAVAGSYVPDERYDGTAGKAASSTAVTIAPSFGTAPPMLLSLVDKLDGGQGLELLNKGIAEEEHNLHRKAEQTFAAAIEQVRNAPNLDVNLLAELLTRRAVALVNLDEDAKSSKLIREALQISEKQKLRDKAARYTILGLIAKVSARSGQLSSAEQYYRDALIEIELADGKASISYGIGLSNIAFVVKELGRYPDAENLFIESMDILRPIGDEAKSHYANSLGGLGEVYLSQHRQVNAEQAILGSSKLVSAIFGETSKEAANAKHVVGEMYLTFGESKKAIPYMEEALKIKEKLYDPDGTAVALALHQLASAYQQAKRYQDAERLYLAALDIRERKLGPEHLYTASTVENLGGLYDDLDQPGKAIQSLNRALSIKRHLLGEDHPNVALTFRHIGDFHFVRGQYKEAHQAFASANKITIDQITGSWLSPDSVSSSSEAAQQWSQGAGFVHEIQAAYEIGRADPSKLSQMFAESFVNSQWAEISQASATLSLMAGRDAVVEEGAKREVRRLQDLEVQLRRLRLEAIESHVSLDVAVDQEQQRGRLMAEEALVDQIRVARTRVRDAMPKYFEYISPSPLTVERVQKQLLAEDEALIAFVVTPLYREGLNDQVFMLALTKDNFAFVKSNMRGMTVRAIVESLRCGLDDTYWDQPRILGSSCAELVNRARPEGDQPLPFRFDYSHLLYANLIAPLGDIITGKRLLIVPSGPLQKLPFHVLVTQDAGGETADKYEGYKGIHWLGLDYTISILPSINSLGRLRVRQSPARGMRPFIGFGDPALANCDDNEQQIECPAPAPKTMGRQSLTEPKAPHRTKRNLPYKLEAAGQTSWDRDAIRTTVRSMCRLPETATELRCIAKSLNVTEDTLFLADRMSKAALLRLDSDGELDNYRIVHFATHGLIASDLPMGDRVAEPSLIFTPPVDGDLSSDDGLLRASEVAKLHLSADAVVLSACNTASTSEQGKEALSGLSQAFFYAGARSIIVSHWAVDTEAAVTLATSALTNGDLAEGLREGMKALMEDTSRPDYAHPSVWAPFIFVGATEALRSR
ncbi:exported hypothetical protein [Mesorhizobium prunaredense]|uniref:CHAT domain-containing protein n=1 Tax=Mesorhizobium prunaredense TaxID=1631249 RepID=A0A1R3VK50_9HYPH|nr:CHAT domain-containing tetratricopeptide repeat protein [Mesorhizobium prunaredense]SIT58814.1 exported hypothetical protein [Mesorhizobium prunaredense]